MQKIIWAARRGRTEDVIALLDMGANVDSTDEVGPLVSKLCAWPYVFFKSLHGNAMCTLNCILQMFLSISCHNDKHDKRYSGPKVAFIGH